MGRDTHLAKALYKGYEASDLHIPSYGTIFISVRDEDKERVTKLARRFDRLGFKLIATEGTANMFAEAGITTGVVEKFMMIHVSCWIRLANINCNGCQYY